AFVIDRCWNLFRANRGALNLTQFLTSAAPAASPSDRSNLTVALLAPDAIHFMRGVQAGADADRKAETADLLNRLLAMPPVPTAIELVAPEEAQPPALPIHFRRNDTSLRLFTTIATLGTPRDVTLEDGRIASRGRHRHSPTPTFPSPLGGVRVGGGRQHDVGL